MVSRSFYAALLMALLAICVSCERKTGVATPRDELRQQAIELARQVREAFPSGASVLLLVLTDTEGNIPESFRIQQSAIEENLAGGGYTVTVSGPDLRRRDAQEVMSVAMHDGWPADLLDAWISAKKVDVVVSLVVLHEGRRASWPRIISLEDTVKNEPGSRSE